ncbi:MAG TPA: mannosyltransferase family protein [Chloroflexota bacterium]|nr:mannosyltransferase family protein [Chloroflexota bacterium]
MALHTEPAAPAAAARRWLLGMTSDMQRLVVPAFVISRVLLLVGAMVALRLFALNPGDGPWPGSPTTAWIAALSRWDGKWYLAIARDGYAYHESAASSINFAPAYPALMRLVGQAVGRTDNDGLLGIGILLSNGALLVALVLLYFVARRIEDEGVARRAALWLVCFPSTLYLSAVYPESLFLALTLAAYLLSLEGRWALAALVAAPAVLTRNYGALVLVPLAWEYLTQHRWRPSWDLAWLLVVPAVFVAWQGYLWALTGDPLAMPHASEQWGRRLTPPWEMLRYYLSLKYWTAYVGSGGALADDRNPIDLSATISLGVLVLLSWRLRRRSLAVLASALYLPAIATGGFIAVPRYALEVFPIFLVLARLTRDVRVLVPLLAASAGLAVAAMAWFALGGWLA